MGETYYPVGKNSDGSWFQLADGRWIAAIDGVSCSNCGGLPVVPTPLIPTRVPPTQIRWASIDLPDGSAQDQANYVFNLLDQKGYGNLVNQLRALPEIANANPEAYIEPLADIAALALTATDPEVREAYDLMIHGGMGNSLVSYGSNWNTQLQVLFWLAENGEFRINDNLAQAIAISNGLWVAMGDDAVDKAVRRDVARFLDFQRKYNPRVEDYPFGALTILSWMGNYSPSGGRVFPLRKYTDQPINLEIYDWNTVSIETLLSMREKAKDLGWATGNNGTSVEKIEYYFYFDRGPQGGNSSHWVYASDVNGHANIQVDGRSVANHDLNNPDFIWRHYLETGKGLGECGDNAVLVEAIGKSLGIPVTFVIRQATDQEKVVDSHMFPIYFDGTGSWKAYHKELDVGKGQTFNYTLYISIPPVKHDGYLDYWLEEPYRVRWFGNMYHIPRKTFALPEIRNMFLSGVSEKDMRNWIFSR